MPLRFTAAALAPIALALPAIAGTWTVEKDGSGDFTIIQDAIDAAAVGDSILVGPGRYDDFRAFTSTVDNFQFYSIARIKTPNLTLLGAGAEFTTLGPDSVVTLIDGLFATGIFLDGGSAGSVVRGFRVENTAGSVRIRDQVEFTDCFFQNHTDSPSINVFEGDGVVIANCDFDVCFGVVTGSPLVTGIVIENCSFEAIPVNEFGVVIGNGSTDALIRGCTFDGFEDQLQFSLSSTGTVETCQFIGTQIVAVDLSSGAAVMRGCTIEAGARFPLRVNAGILEVYDSIIGGGELATILVAGDMFVRNSHILNGGALSVDSRGAVTRTVDLIGNWWGTSDPTTISAWISDLNGNVLYEPILTGPVPTKVESVSGLKALFDELGAASQNRR